VSVLDHTKAKSVEVRLPEVYEVGMGLNTAFPFPEEGTNAQQEESVKLRYLFEVTGLPFREQAHPNKDSPNCLTQC